MQSTRAKAGPGSPREMPADYHVHTPLCGHAEGEATEFRQAAAARGLAEMCFTDHAPSPDGYDASHRMNIRDFPRYCAFVQELQDGRHPEVLFGIEADYYPRCEDFLRRWLPEQPFDLVIGSVHYLGSWGFDDPDQIAAWKSADVPTVWGQYLRSLQILAASRLYDVVGHFDLPKKFGHRIAENVLRDAVQPALDAIAASGMAVEINTGGLRKPAEEIYPSPLILSLARERNIPICFGSDAHRPAEVGSGFEQAVTLARQAGYVEYVRFRRRKRTAVPLPSA